ncbi:MAG: methyltransferase domain-containing protein [Paludibacteraceae bacterium]
MDSKSTKPMTGHLDNAWIQVDNTADPDFFIRFLDASRARSLEFAQKNPEVAFAHLLLEPGMSLLDCGCGTGDMLSLMARITAPGVAIGGDLSSSMINEARKRAAKNPQENLRFEIMDVQDLAFPDSYFDRVLATQLLIHVPDPIKSIHEICRITRPKGLVVIADMDWDSLLVGCSNRELGRKFTHLFTDGIRNGLIVRDYPGLLRSEGFSNIKIIPQQIVFDSWPFVKEWIIEPTLSTFLAQGSMSPSESQAFLDDLEIRNAGGYHFASLCFYTIIGQRI